MSESQTASQPALEQCFLQGRFPERNNGTSEGLKQLEKFIGLAKPLDPTGKRYPKLLVAETNTPHEKQRPEWFTAVCTRMHRYGSNSVGVLTYWNRTGKLSGPWLSHDKATIKAMKTIIDSIFS